jgi:hypothetical protein
MRKTATVAAKPDTPPTPVQEALQITWLLKGKLKSAQIAYLRIGELLVQVRDRKLYAALKHADLEEYAFERLQLGRASLFRYLQAYDWVSKSYPEWLEPKPKGYIPDLSDVADLIWIEKELTRTDLAASTRAALATLQQKALEGKLKQSDLDAFRRKPVVNKEVIKTCLSKLRTVRRRFAELKSVPPEVITHLDAAISILNNAKA